MIRLHSLKIERFRGIREGAIEGFGDVNLLIGRNNCGKSTVVEAVMKMLWEYVRNADVLGRNVHHLWSQIRQDAAGYHSESWFRQDRIRPIVFTGNLKAVGRGITTSQGALPESYILPLSTTITSQAGQTEVSLPSLDRLGLAPLFQQELMRFFAGVAFFRPRDGTDRGIEQHVWSQLLANRRDKGLTKSLNEIFGFDAESFQMLPDNRLLVLFDAYSLPLDSQGDGTRAAIRSLMLLAMTRHSLFIMEEPECHQHPGSLARYARAICGMAKEQDVQLLISTHSAECVGAFLNAAKEKQSQAEVFHLNLTDGKQTARRLDAEAVETLQATGVDVRFLDLYA